MIARPPRHSRHSRHATLWLAALLLAGCGVLPPSAALDRALVGAWCNPAEGGGCWAYDQFRADGRFEACGRAEGDAQPFRGSGRYSVSGSRMCYVVERATPNFWLPPGARYCTDITAIDDRAHSYRDIDTGAVFHLKRVPVADVHCPQ